MNEDFSDLSNNLSNIDRLIHEPARLLVMAILNTVESADFLYLQREAGLTKGNLSSHLYRLEQAGYIVIEKTYRGKLPLTICQLTDQGRQAFQTYREQMKHLIDQNSI